MVLMLDRKGPRGVPAARVFLWRRRRRCKGGGAPGGRTAGGKGWGFEAGTKAGMTCTSIINI